MRLVILFFLFACLGRGFSQTLTVDPNPFEYRTLISFTLSANDTVTVSIIDLTGRVILTVHANVKFTAGAYHDSLRMDTYPPGVYFVSFKCKVGAQKTIKIVKTATVGLPEPADECSIKYYPSPVADELKFSDFCETAIEVLLYDFSGAKTLSAMVFSDNPIINVQHLRPGIYVLEAIAGARRIRARIIKN